MHGVGGLVTAQLAPARTGRNLLVGLVAFLTLVDLFATQAVLPQLTERYGATPAAMSVAVNATTIGMALAGLAVGLLSSRIPRRAGIVASLAILSGPTMLLAHAPDLTTFTALRIVQGFCMASAFTLTLAHLGDAAMSPGEAASAFAAYVTGNVASNLIGRMVSAGLAETLGLSPSFYAFAFLNLAGAGLAAALVGRDAPSGGSTSGGDGALVVDRRLAAAFAVGFCILFAFIGTFTYVTFVLARPPLSVASMSLSLVHLVFLPSIVTTPFAGRLAARADSQRALLAGLASAAAGLPLVVVPNLVAVLSGLVLVAAGTFAAQAVATGLVSRIASGNRGTASGLYLASYFCGGLVGTAALGQIFDAWGWTACVVGIGAALAAAAGLSFFLSEAREA
jgi:MFS transporter, YNFM family, putative membrane transport protein